MNTPPFMEQAADLYLPLKLVFSLLGLLISVIIYQKLTTKRYKYLLSRWPFRTFLGSFVIAVATYLLMFYYVDTPSVFQWFLEIILFSYLNFCLTLIILLLLLLLPLGKLKSAISVFKALATYFHGG